MNGNVSKDDQQDGLVWCPACKVSLQVGVRHCPLCHTELCSEAQVATNGEIPPRIDQHQSASFSGRRGKALLLTSLVLFIPGVVCWTLDYMVGSGNSWSLYVVASLTFAWSIAFLVISFSTTLPVMTALILTAIGGYEMALDMLTGNTGWSLALGWPLSAATAGAFFLYWMAFHVFRKESFYLGSAFTGITVLWCVLIDIFLNLYTKHVAILQWSPIVMAALLPVSLGLLLLGAAWKRSKYLQRFLHW